MGFIALVVFLASLAIFFVSLIVLGWAAREIYRTIRYAQKDSQIWIERFGEYNPKFQDALESMQARGEDIARAGVEIREAIDDMRDVVEEIRASRLVKIVSFVGRRHNR